MNGEVDKVNDEIDVEDDDEENVSPDDTVVITEDLSDIDDEGETTAELDVEELVAKIDKDVDGVRKKEVHRRLEELEEQKRVQAELDSTYNFNLDDEL
jgi:hypothetical protein